MSKIFVILISFFISIKIIIIFKMAFHYYFTKFFYDDEAVPFTVLSSIAFLLAKISIYMGLFHNIYILPKKFLFLI